MNRAQMKCRSFAAFLGDDVAAVVVGILERNTILAIFFTSGFVLFMP